MRMTSARQAVLQAYRKAVRGTGLRQDVSGLSTLKVKSLIRQAEKYREARHAYSRARKNYLRSKAGQGASLPTVKELQESGAGTSEFKSAGRDVRKAAKAKGPEKRSKILDKVQSYVKVPKVLPDEPEPDLTDAYDWLPHNEPGFDERQEERDRENRERLVADAERYNAGQVKLDNLREMINSVSDGSDWRSKKEQESAADLERMLDGFPEDVLMWNLANAPSELIEDATIAISYGKGSTQHSQAMTAIYEIITGEIPTADQMAQFGATAEYISGFEDEELD